jgi:S1-C subfamily serine protease
MISPTTKLLPLALLGGLLPFLSSGAAEPFPGLDKRVADAEEQRAAVIDKIRMSVVAVFARDARTGSVTGSGSGVVISEDGYALTNFHVVAGLPPVMLAGLADGVLYDAVVVGQDKVGDVALIKLFPPKDKPDLKFRAAPLGDSDKCKAGDWSLAMGNPFLLATDFTPTVTYGFISGVNRYQYPEGKFIEYTDCLQIDTSINPGNSGGPLFNMNGELIGINGRGSFDKRVRINSGVGYAISINQIKNFMGHLRAGLFVDHASLGAIVESEAEEGALSKLIVRAMINSDAARRGLEVGDEIVSFAGWPMTSVNAYKNKLGIYPKGWRVPMVYRHDNAKREILVRLMGVIRQEIKDPNNPPDGGPPGPGGRRPIPDSPAKAFYEVKEGFSNYYFNKLERDRVLKELAAHGKFDDVQGTWVLQADGTVKGKRAKSKISIVHKGAKDKTNDAVESIIDGLDDRVEPLAPTADSNLKDPQGSGGLLLALFHYRQLLAYGEKGFGGRLTNGGSEPFYLPPPEKDRPDYKELRVDCDVLRGEFSGVATKFYFAQKDETRTVQGRAYKLQKGQLLGFETLVNPADDPCEVTLLDYDRTEGKMLPREIHVRYQNDTYAVLKDVRFELAKEGK